MLAQGLQHTRAHHRKFRKLHETMEWGLGLGVLSLLPAVLWRLWRNPWKLSTQLLRVKHLMLRVAEKGSSPRVELATFVFRLRDQLAWCRAHTSCAKAQLVSFSVLPGDEALFHDQVGPQDNNVLSCLPSTHHANPMLSKTDRCSQKPN